MAGPRRRILSRGGAFGRTAPPWLAESPSNVGRLSTGCASKSPWIFGARISPRWGADAPRGTCDSEQLKALRGHHLSRTHGRRLAWGMAARIIFDVLSSSASSFSPRPRTTAPFDPTPRSRVEEAVREPLTTGRDHFVSQVGLTKWTPPLMSNPTPPAGITALRIGCREVPNRKSIPPS